MVDDNMSDKTMLISEIGKEILNAKGLMNREWSSLSLVIDLGEGHFAQSGYLYTQTDVDPFTAITAERRKLSTLCNELKDVIKEESDSNIKQLLVQIRNDDSQMKINFEFENANRWSITPSNMVEMKEMLKPVFD
jgi:hypothetical protein